MRIRRRDLLVWSAGAAAGLLATPVPWKILDDVSIWSQNWPWIPQPARGPVEVKPSFCTLCPKGCGVRVRMAAGWPVGVAGSSTHPISRGALCPLAFAAHQLNWHPQRLRTVRHDTSASGWTQAQAAFARACKEGPIVVIDGYPGRAGSAVLQSFAEKQGGSYRVAPTAELRALRPYEEWTGFPAASFGYDLENANTIVSFGAPLLDGWGTPGRFTRPWAESAASMDDPRLRLIQIDATLSRTAARAAQWIQIREGSESALASGLARALLEQNLVPAHGPVPSMTLSEVSTQTGIGMERIRELARVVAADRPALAISGDYEPAVAALNVLLGSVCARGGMIRNSAQGKSCTAPDVSIENARAVLIDATAPCSFKLHTEGEIFRFAAWDGAPIKANWLLPAPGFLEELTDIPTAIGSSLPTYAVTPAIVKSTTEVHTAAQMVGSIDASLLAIEKVIDNRCEEMLRQGIGTVCAQQATPLSKFTSVASLKEQFWKGAVWVGEPSLPGSLPCGLRQWPTSTPAVAAEDWASGWNVPVMPPLASKLYIESTLRESPGRRNA